MNQAIRIPKQYKKTMFGIDLVLHQSEWEEGQLHLSFQPRVVATLTKEFVLERTGSMMDLLVAQFTEDGRLLGNTEFGKEMEKALGNIGTDEKIGFPADTEINIFGAFAVFGGPNYKPGRLGSIQEPICIGSPTGYSKYMSFFPAEDLFIDWLAVNGSAIMITDITAKQMIQRFYSERTKGAGERAVMSVSGADISHYANVRNDG